ncbi:GNAT family N-acetyltransferase [Deinococcus sp. HMF7604]|uniref:GNAT family N-acetyltransferase n=1 Tax=Deinococcus betulae TaxID=2873312 RepID=UPI001CCB5DC4|nr:GNAT family protein [Deinococcus betulae]MBZ9749858.1 GNAT family N-acetyltransferase [Deinococcus betulae]
MTDLSSLLAALPSLRTPRLLLRPLGPSYLNQVMASLQDPEAMRLTGTATQFTADQVSQFLTAVQGAENRADWAILRLSDGLYLGEAVLNDLDAGNRSMNFRIGLSSSEVFGQGYGSEATQAVVRYGFDHLDLHRISLGVYAFNPRARRVYHKCGFIDEGLERQALHWEGVWVDQHRMARLATDPAGEMESMPYEVVSED